MPTIESVQTEFGLHLQFVDEQNQVLRDDRLKPSDFGHAIRHTQFDAFRHQLTQSYDPSAIDGARIEPLFLANSSSPRAKGFSVTVRLAGGGEHRCEFESSYFAPIANQFRADLLRTQQMTSEQELYYQFNAYLDDALPERPASKLAISLEPPTHGVPVVSGCRRDLGIVETWDGPTDTDLPVLIDRSVLEEAVEEARATPEREIAGFLLGRLHRDESTGEVFLRITGLVSASGTTESSETSVTYTPASFAQVKNIVRLRGEGELICGWSHSHPFKFCAECPIPAPPECIAKVLFYSQDDLHLMATTFESPFMVGLLAAIEPRIEQAIGHLPVKLYGWRNGQIKERGFEVIGSEV